MRILSYNISHEVWTCTHEHLGWICAQIVGYTANIVCLQHVYTRGARDFVYARLCEKYPYSMAGGGFMLFAEQPFAAADYCAYQSNCWLWKTGFLRINYGATTLYVVDSPSDKQYAEVLEDAALQSSVLLLVLGTFGSEQRLRQTAVAFPGAFDCNDVGMRTQFSYVDGTRPDVAYVLRCPPRCYPDSVLGMIGHLWLSSHLPVTFNI